jgi:type IV secretion system protein VirD4
MTLADALVHDSAGQGGEAHWNEEAKALIAGLILYGVVHEDRERRTLATVRDYLTLAPRILPICSPACRTATAPAAS